MYKSVLVPVDLHHVERGKVIIGRAQKLADDESRIILLNVIEEIPSYVETYLPKDAMQHNVDDAREKMKALAKAASIKADIYVKIGVPHNEILALAEEEKVDLIMVASHHPGLQDYLIGSTAARVVRHADCSVLIDR